MPFKAPQEDRQAAQQTGRGFRAPAADRGQGGGQPRNLSDLITGHREPQTSTAMDVLRGIHTGLNNANRSAAHLMFPALATGVDYVMDRYVRPNAPGVAEFLSPKYQPHTVPGQYARTLAEMLPNAATGGEGLLAKAASVAVPALASETAGQLTKGTRYEAPARIGAAIVGGGLTGLRPGAPRSLNAPAPTAVRTLRTAGVNLTPGQRFGGLAKNAEDLAMRAPVVGPAISGARMRGNESLNRAVALRAVQPIGGTVPRNVRPGYDMVKNVEDQIGDVYDKAAAMVPKVSVDQPLLDDIATINERSSDLPESLATTFSNIVKDRLTRLGGENVDGAKVKAIHSELGGLARSYTAAGGPEAVLGGMVDDLRSSLMGLVGRHSPDAADLISKADKAWSQYSIMNDAAAAASGREGVFTPGQLTTQVRAAGRRASPNIVGKGDAALQDLSTAASSVMPDQFGNPGTANAIGLGGLLTGAATDPGKTALVGAGLTAAATPYFLMGRRSLEQLPEKATAAQLDQAAGDLALLARHDPQVQSLQQELAIRRAAVSGVLASGAAQ